MSKKKRSASRQRPPQAKGYSEAGASMTRRALKGFIPNSGSPADDINSNNSTLRQRSRMLYMSSPVATSAIQTNRTKIIGVGLTQRSEIDRQILGLSPEAAKTWQKRTEAEWKLWSSKRQNCDAIGLNNFPALQQLALKSWLMSGDVFALIKRRDATPLNPYGLRIHLIEADRVSTPAEYRSGVSAGGFTDVTIPEGKPGAGNKIHDGVEVDADGCVVAYHICNGYPGEFASANLKWVRVLAYGEKTGLPNVLHIMDAERPDQYRGVPYLAPVIEPLLQLRRYTESELMAALVQSFFTAWIQTKTNPAEIPFNEVGSGDISSAGDESGENADSDNMSSDPNEYEMGPGTVLHLEPDEEVHFGNPNIPTAGFDTFVKTLCRLVGAALEEPYDVLLKEFNSSYSSSRGALMEAWDGFKMKRSWFVDAFCKPIYEIWLAEAVALHRLDAPGFFDDPIIREAWSGTRWIGPVQGQLDPKKEAEAAILLINRGLKTHEQVTREIGGGDWEENIAQLKHENELLAASGFSTESIVINSDPKERGAEGGDGGGD